MMKYMLMLTLIVLMLTGGTLLSRDYEIYDSKTGESITMQQFVERSSKFDIIFFGEFHDDSLLHMIQAKYLAEWIKRNPKTTVSFEMFERDVQNVINDYLAGKISEKDFLKKSRPWPDYLQFYKPMLELAKKNNLPFLATNIPRRYAALYARKGMTGINSLPPEQRKYITKEIVIKDDEYLKKFYNTMMLNMGMDTNEAISPNQENTLYLYYGAQVIKDETMAESIADFLKSHAGWKVVHFNGDFHSNNYLGTVAKLRRRMPALSIGIITPAYKKEGKPFKFTADYIGKTNFLIQLPVFERPQRDFAMMGHGIGQNFVVKHNIAVELFTEKQSLKGNDVITFKNPVLRKASLTLLRDLNVKSITSPDGGIDFEIKPNSKDSTYNEIIVKRKKNEIQTVNITYEGVVYNSPKKLTLNERHSNSAGIISAKEGEGIYLPAGSYYPMTENDMADFSIRITVPKNTIIVTSGKTDKIIEDGNKETYYYVSELKADNFTIGGGQYNVKYIEHDGVRFGAYTFAATKNADVYLNASVKYYDIYSKLLGHYPYSNFSIVENFFATGFGMPAYTLLSNRLMAMPWIILTPGSLAHEFVHNWWGNSVYTSYKKGNWCEALTTFSANYYYNVITNNPEGALDWRKKALISIEALPEELNYPVADFKYQANKDDAVIGYQKGAFIFYEIMKLMGKDSFFKALRTFASKYKGMRATWFSLRYVLNMQAKKDGIPYNISKIMNEWLTSKKIPALRLDYISFDGDSLRFNINQFGTTFTSSIPVFITTDKGIDTVYYTITKEKNRFAYKPEGELKTIRLDKDYQTLRHLYKWEIPYSFNQTLNNNPLLVLPAKKSTDYKVALQLAEMMKQSGYKMDYTSADDLPDSLWQKRTLIVIGNSKSNPFFVELNNKYPDGINIDDLKISIDGKEYEAKDKLLLLNMRHPATNDEFTSMIYADKLDNIRSLQRLFHYLSYSMVFLNKNKVGRAIRKKEIFPVATEIPEMEYNFPVMYR
jgi:uncharacterized iron-regulated protein